LVKTRVCKSNGLYGVASRVSTRAVGVVSVRQSHRSLASGFSRRPEKSKMSREGIVPLRITGSDKIITGALQPRPVHTAFDCAKGKHSKKSQIGLRNKKNCQCLLVGYSPGGNEGTRNKKYAFFRL